MSPPFFQTAAPDRPTYTRRSASLEECFAHTDLEWRLGAIPSWATVRGVYMAMLDRQAADLGPTTHEEYRAFFRVGSFSPLRQYPARDYVTRLAVLAQIHWGGPAIYQGIRRIQARAFDTWTSTVVGRAALALFEPTFLGCLRFCERAYETGVPGNYARFTVESADDRLIVTRFDNEYVYIEHAMVGALEGVAKICGEQATFEAELDGAFDGRVLVRRL